MYNCWQAIVSKYSLYVSQIYYKHNSFYKAAHQNCPCHRSFFITNTSLGCLICHASKLLSLWELYETCWLSWALEFYAKTKQLPRKFSLPLLLDLRKLGYINWQHVRWRYSVRINLQKCSPCCFQGKVFGPLAKLDADLGQEESWLRGGNGLPWGYLLRSLLIRKDSQMVDPLLHTSLEAYSAIGVNHRYALVVGVVLKTSRILFALGRREHVDSDQRAKCNLLLSFACTKRVAPMRLICGMFYTHLYVDLSAMRYYYAAGERRVSMY